MSLSEVFLYYLGESVLIATIVVLIHKARDKRERDRSTELRIGVYRTDTQNDENGDGTK